MNIFTFQHYPSKNILTGILSARILLSKWKEVDIKPTQTSPVPPCNLLYCPSFKAVFFLPKHKHMTNHKKSYILKIGKIILVKQKDLSRKVKSKRVVKTVNECLDQLFQIPTEQRSPAHEMSPKLWKKISRE